MFQRRNAVRNIETPEMKRIILDLSFVLERSFVARRTITTTVNPYIT